MFEYNVVENVESAKMFELGLLLVMRVISVCCVIATIYVKFS